MLRNKELQRKLRDIDEFIAQYKQNRPERERDWRTYEEQYALHIKEAIRQLRPLIDQAVDTLRIAESPGRPHQLTLKQRVLLLLLQRLFGQSNRMMASMLAIFSILSDIEVSYKTIERLYSDPEVELALHNLHTLILKKKGISTVDGSGDGTGYSLTITKHYATEAAKKNEAKQASTEAKKAFVYSFKLMDVKTRMYVTYGTSLKSEKGAFERAMRMLSTADVELDSVRLDRYYSAPRYVDAFGKTKVYVIPKKNATIRGSRKWKRTLAEFVHNTPAYLEQYYLRESSENGWSVDKRRFGWDIMQRREDRIDTADLCTTLWHNLFNLGPL